MPKNKLKSYLSNGAAGIVEGKDIPIADLFPFTTVLFAGELSIRTNSAIYVPFVCSQTNVYFSSLHCIYSLIDIAGFTAWSSVREPSQVFSLLETIYGSFDKIAQKRKVFKVSLARIVCSDVSNWPLILFSFNVICQVETIGDCYVAGKFSFRMPNSSGFHVLQSS